MQEVTTGLDQIRRSWREFSQAVPEIELGRAGTRFDHPIGSFEDHHEDGGRRRRQPVGLLICSWTFVLKIKVERPIRVVLERHPVAPRFGHFNKSEFTPQSGTGF
jgi:hypothetical protein